MSDDPYRQGRAAARRGEPRSACPASPSSPEGLAWCRGWTDNTWTAREISGRALEDTQRMKREAWADAQDDPAYRTDPVAEILDVPDPYEAPSRDRWIHMESVAPGWEPRVLTGFNSAFHVIDEVHHWDPGPSPLNEIRDAVDATLEEAFERAQIPREHLGIQQRTQALKEVELTGPLVIEPDGTLRRERLDAHRGVLRRTIVTPAQFRAQLDPPAEPVCPRHGPMRAGTCWRC